MKKSRNLSHKKPLVRRRVLDVENVKTYYPDFKTANKCFKIVKGLVLAFGGEEFLPFLFLYLWI
jgi:hypothetical protein